MTDEIILFGEGLDQPLQSKDDKVLDIIRNAVTRAKANKDVNIAIDTCTQLVRIVKMSGRGLAEGLWLIWKDWSEFGLEDDPIEYIYTHTGLHRATVERYIRIANMLNNPDTYGIPAKLVEEIGQRNIKELVPVSTALAQGYEISEKQWNKIANAADFSEVAAIIREDVKNKSARSNLLVIRMDREGNLYAFDNMGVQATIGYLEVDRSEALAKKAIERIITNTGILQP